MSKEYKFSINVYIDNVSLLETTISSLIEDREFFCSHVQIVLIDSLVTKESAELCFKYTDEFPENIYFVDCQGESAAEGYNDARVICLGSYISFIRAGDYYSRDTLKDISEAPAFMKAPAICVAAETSRNRNGAVPYNFGANDGTVNLRIHPERVGLILGAYFFKSEAVSELRFKKSLSSDFDTAFILDLLVQVKSYLYTSKFKFSTVHTAEDDISNLTLQYRKSYFTDSVSCFSIPILQNKGDSPITMNIVMYLIYVKLACGLNDRYMFTMGPNSVNDFFNLVSTAMQMIDDAVILNRNIAKRASLPPELTFKMLRLKYRNKSLKPVIDFYPIGTLSEYAYRNAALRIEKVRTNGCFTATLDGALISSSEHIDVKIMSINLEEASLRFSGYVTDLSCLDRFDIKLFAVANRDKIPFKEYPFYSLRTLFEVPFDKGYGFTFSVPLKSVKEMTVISFYITIGGMSYKLKFSFGAVGAHLTEKLPHSYFVNAGRMVTFDLDDKTITIRRATAFMQSKNERLLLSDIKHSVPINKYIKIKRMRKRYHSTVDKYADRKIWLMCDSEDSRSDDAHELYSYINSLHDKRGVEAFYSQRGINPDDAFLMTAFQSTSVSCGSAVQKTVAMNADVIVCSGHNVYKALGFEDGEELYYRDLLMADIVSFGDGYSMFRSAQTENRMYDNVMLRFCNSRLEYDRLMHPIYGYDEKHLFSFGYPHMDTLKPVPSRQILVCPSIRRGFAKYAQLGYASFSKEPLYSVFNAFIHDERLLSLLNQYHCSLVLILPDNLAKKSHIWNKSENVAVSSFEDLGYKETIEKSAMLITDYSNSAFDFAYMRKPVIYYQNPDVSPQDNISSFSYRDRGFGEVVTDLDALIEQLQEVIRSEFRLSAKYLKRREEFFSFIDRGNCRRIANAIYDFKYEHEQPKPNVKGGFGEPMQQAPAAQSQNVRSNPSETKNAAVTVAHEQKQSVQRTAKNKSQQDVRRVDLQHQNSSDKQQKQARPRSEVSGNTQPHSARAETRSSERIPPKPQSPEQSVRFAKPPQGSRPASSENSQPHTARESYTAAKKAPSKSNSMERSVRFAESPQRSHPPVQPKEQIRQGGGSRYAEQRSTGSRQAPARSNGQRSVGSNSTPRRAASERQSPRVSPKQQDSHSRQSSSKPRHASPPDKRGGSFRRF